MTIASLTEGKIRNHRASALIYDEFAAAAENEGKVHMAMLYRTVASGHRARIESLQDLLGQTDSHHLPVVRGLFERGREVLTA
jgi:rubrerythrin